MDVAAANFNTAPSLDDFTNWEPEPGKPFSLSADLPFVYDLIPREIRPPEPRWGWKGVVKSLAVHAGMPLTGLLAPGSKGMCLYTSWGGMGDEILHTAVVRELAKKLGGPVWVLSLHPWVYREHPAAKGVIPPDGHVISLAKNRGKLRFSGYARQNERDRPPWLRHQIAMICEGLGLVGEIELKPEVFLTSQEIAKARSYAGCVVVQSSVLGARFPSYNKQWPPERMAEVVKGMRKNHRVVQIGGAQDPLLPGVEDFRGHSDLRHVSALLANAALFVGMEGFHTHLARAVNCRSVVVYGGYTRPDETGYPCNENLYTELPCSPCWEPSGCNFRRKCLDVIMPSDVLAAVERALAKKDQPLETTTVHLPASS